MATIATISGMAIIVNMGITIIMLDTDTSTGTTSTVGLDISVAMMAHEDVKDATMLARLYEEGGTIVGSMGMLKKAASGVLASLPCSRTVSTLRASNWLRPFPWKRASWRPWVWAGDKADFFDHSHRGC